jgi:hypothetical protein
MYKQTILLLLTNERFIVSFDGIHQLQLKLSSQAEVYLLTRFL